VDRHATRRTVNRYVNRARERRALLHQTVIEQPEGAVLRKDTCLIVDRTIPEFEYQVVRHAITPRNLNQVAMGNGTAIHRAQEQKTVDESLSVANRNGCAR
jgi:hypothetical protein